MAYQRIEFADLNDEIGSDDWLIPSEEIANRKLIKQTPRYNVYKADWFGDVLVYEPVNALERKQQQLVSRRQRINQDELSCRLSRLNLTSNNLMMRSPSPNASLASPFGSNTFDIEQNDSAYSSISSTPQYHTKNIKSEFEFPQNRSGSPLSTTSSGVDENNNEILAIQMEESSIQEKLTSESKTTSGNGLDKPRSPVILNKESFKFSFGNELCCVTEEREETQDGDTCRTRSTWFELNELRLIAHENFMLFMGASMDQLENDGTSLVMQMNHPKAVSLYYLLHGSNLSSSSSPIDRFFTFKQHQRQQLTNGAKLNICQQVMNAMTYLHEKNIVHGKLTSVNIYLELNQRVKISLIDEDERAIVTPFGQQNSHINCVEFNLPSLTYLSPELIKTVSVVNTAAATVANSNCDNSVAQVQFDTNQLTKASDIFSFGTLLFELFEGRFPFAQVQDTATIINSLKLSILDSPTTQSSSAQTPWNGNIEASANELIYQIGSGQIGSKNLMNLGKMKCPALVELIIEKCWSLDPLMRPQFKQLATEL